MAKRRLIIAGNPVPQDWEFQRGLADETGWDWEVKRWCINEYGGIKKYTRYLKYLFYPVYLALIRNRYAKIIAWEQFFGLVLACYLRFFHAKKCPELDIMTFIYRPKKGAVGRIYQKFVRYAVTSKYIHKIYVFGQSEIDHYVTLFGVPKEKFAAETLGIADIADEIHAMPPKRQDKFYIAPGRSNRDYNFLRSAWQQADASLCIVCDVETAQDAANIHYEKDLHGNEYQRLLADAYAVIVPLQSETFSSGQLVLLQAAMLGKPVIVTKNDTVCDYLVDGKTGYQIEKTAEALHQAMNKLDDPETYRQMCCNARKKFESDFSLYELGRRVGRQQNA